MYTKEDIDAYMATLPAKGYKSQDIEDYRNHLMTNFGPDAPGGSASRAVPGDVLSHTERLKASFGNDQGLTEMLKSKGYSDVKRDENGALIAKDPTGKYVREPQNFFPSDWSHPLNTAHPLNYAEANLGAALPTAGMVVGGTYGSIPGAAGGSMVGEGARTTIGKKLGTYQGDLSQQAYDAATEGLKGGIAETGGAALNMLPVKKLLPRYFSDETLGGAFKSGTDYWLDQAKSALARASSLGTLGKVPARSAERMLNRPDEVMGMTRVPRPGEASDVVQNVAENSSTELNDRLKRTGEAVSQANDEFLKKYGKNTADTTPVLNKSRELIEEIPINEYGGGRLSAQDLNERTNWERNNLTTKKFGPEPAPNALYSRPVFEEPTIENYIDQKPRQLKGYQSRVPEKSYGDLKPTADELARSVGNYWDANPLGKRLPPDLAHKEVLYGKIKELLHKQDPNLASADQAYSSLKTDARLLKSLESPGRGEGFISNLMGKNKTEAQRAASRAIPETYYGPVQDLNAARDFAQGGLAQGHYPTATQTIRGAASAALGYGANRFGVSTPDSIALAAMLAAATDPSLHKYGLYLSSKLGEPVGRELSRASSQFIPLTIKNSTPWSLFGGDSK